MKQDFSKVMFTDDSIKQHWMDQMDDPLDGFYRGTQLKTVLGVNREEAV